MYEVYRRDLRVDTLTPVLLYRHLANRPYSFLLESVVGGERLGRYSFVGLEPERVIRIQGSRVSVLDPITSRPVYETVEDRGLEMLRQFHRHTFHTVPSDPDYPLSSGWVGYLGYDIARRLERLPPGPPDLLGIPDAMLIFPRLLVAFDHLLQRLTLFVHHRPGRRREAQRYADEVVRRIRSTRTAFELFSATESPPRRTAVTSNVTRRRFHQMVQKARQHIQRGDIFQVVLSQRFQSPYEGDPFWIYRALRSLNPSPYMFYLKFRGYSLVGSSPEILVRQKGGKVFLRPIAGTRRRGQNESEDKALEQELLTDPKERAEHLMLVDLGRNDVGAVAQFGSVHTTEAFMIERYSAVMHLVSQVEGLLRPGKDAFDVFSAAFPAGTVTGAPKIRAMEIINSLEPTRRGPYAGAVGYFGAGGSMDFCITIRTLLVKEGMAYVQAGAGVVHDSRADREYVETENKAKALVGAVDLARQMSSSESRGRKGSAGRRSS